MTKLNRMLNHYGTANSNFRHDSSLTQTRPDTGYSTTKLSDSEFQNMRVADAVAKTSDKLMHKGNQRADVWETDFHSTAATTYGRNNFGGTHGGMNNPLSSGLWAGNCGEAGRLQEKIASSTLNDMGSSAPITRATYHGDHEFTVIGDPREKSGTAVIDGWVNRPSAHLFEQNVFARDQETGVTVQSATDFRNASPSLLNLDVGQDKYDLASTYENKAFGHELNSREKKSWFSDVVTDYRGSGAKMYDHDFADVNAGKGLSNVYERSSDGEKIGFDFMGVHDKNAKIDNSRLFNSHMDRLDREERLADTVERPSYRDDQMDWE